MPRRGRARRRRPARRATSGDWVFGVHAPPGTGVAEVFGDLVAAVVTERARRIAELADPAAAFGETRTWGPHTVAEPAGELAGFEIVLTAPDPGDGPVRAGPGLPPIGAAWRDRAARADYFASTARLADGVGAWAMLAARLGDRAANRAFADRWWHGAVRGTDVLFPAGRVDGRRAAAAERDDGLLAGVRLLVQVRAGEGREPGRGTDGGGQRPSPASPSSSRRARRLRCRSRPPGAGWRTWWTGSPRRARR